MKQPAISLPTLRELVRIALPMVVSQGAFAAMVFTDRYFMSRLDATHIAAALGGGVGAFFTTALFTGTVAYANALVAQYHGAGQLSNCSRVVSQGLLMSLLCLPFIGLIAWGFGDVFALMGHDARQVELERQYFYVLVAGSVFTLAKTCFACFFAGIGQTRVVMVCDVAGVLLNILLTWMLVFGKFGVPPLGITGAALGTVIATVFSIALFLLFYLEQSNRRRYHVSHAWRFDRAVFRRYLRLGAPSGLEMFMNIATFNLFLLMYQSYGVVEGAAMAIVFNWDMLNFVPLIGMQIGVMTLIGRFVGAGDLTRANQVISAGFLVALTYSGILGVCFILFREPLLLVFSRPGEDFSQILALGSTLMIGLATYVLADATVLVSGGVLRGAGDTRWMMVISVSLHWIMVVAQYFIIMEWKLGPVVSFWCFVIMLIVLAGLYLWRLLGGTWRRPERLSRVMAQSS